MTKDNNNKFSHFLKGKIIAGIFAIFAALGLVFLNQLTTFTNEVFFSGVVEIVTDDDILKQHSEMTVLDVSRSPQRTFLLNTQSSVKLSPGNYIIQIFYPKADNTRELIFEKPILLKRWGHEKIILSYKLPNIIIVKLELPKDNFLPEEQLSIQIRSNRDGYLWLFAPDDKGNPNSIFPNEDYTNNHIEAGKGYSIPPDNSFAIKTNAAPGEETIVSIVTQSNDKEFALACLKKVFPSVSVKLAVTHEALWGYDKKTIKVE